MQTSLLVEIKFNFEIWEVHFYFYYNNQQIPLSVGQSVLLENQSLLSNTICHTAELQRISAVTEKIQTAQDLQIHRGVFFLRTIYSNILEDGWMRRNEILSWGEIPDVSAFGQ